MSQELLPIDVDLVRDLKRRGKGRLANELLHAYRDNARDNMCQLSRELHKQNYDIKRFHGICYQNGCYNKTRKGYAACVKHLEHNRERWRKQYASIKNRRIHSQHVAYVDGCSISISIHVGKNGEVNTNSCCH